MSKEISDLEATTEIKAGDICMVLDPVEALGALVLVYKAEEHSLPDAPESPYIPDRENLLRRAGSQMIRGFSLSVNEPILSNDMVLEPDETGLSGELTVHASLWTNLLYSGQVSKVSELDPKIKDQKIRLLKEKAKEYGRIIIDEEEAHQRIGELCRVSNRSRWPVHEIGQNLNPIYRQNMAESTAKEGDICRIEEPETGQEHLVWIIDEDKEEGPVVHFYMAELAGGEVDHDSFVVEAADGQAYKIFPKAYGLNYGFNLKPVTKTEVNVEETTDKYMPGVEKRSSTVKNLQMCEAAKRLKRPVWGDDESQ